MEWEENWEIGDMTEIPENWEVTDISKKSYFPYLLDFGMFGFRENGRGTTRITSAHNKH